MLKIFYYIMNLIFYVVFFFDYNFDGEIVFIIKFSEMLIFFKNLNDLYFKENVFNYFLYRSIFIYSG